MSGANYPGALRASDDDRRRVADILSGAFAEGRLTQQEWDHRVGELATTATYADLDRLTADLPAVYPGPQYAPAQVSRTQPGPGVAPWQPAINRMAIASLVCGVGQLVAFFPAGIAAIVLGHQARRQIRETGEQGDGLARTGLVLGYVGTVGVLLIVLLVVAGLAVVSTRHAGTSNYHP